MGKLFKPHAVLGLTNSGGITIQIDYSNDMVRYQWYNNKPSKRWQAIKYNKIGLPYIRVKNTRYYLNQFMKI